MEKNKLAAMPIPQLLVDMSLPMMISFFIQALYNIVDSMFVARISENALTAVSLAFPMQQIANAIAVGIGVGINALIPRYAAKQDLKGANDTAHTGIFLNLMFYLLFLVLGCTVPHAFYAAQTNISEIVEYGTMYLRIAWCVSLGVFSGQYFEKMLVCSGHSVSAMTAQAAGAIFNIVFDPLLIFGIGPFPALGIAGAAWATVLGQILAAVVAFILNLHKNQWIQFHIKEIKYRSKITREIFEIGIPSMITIGLNSLTALCVNVILLGYSTTATAVYGIWLKLQNFCYMPIFGLNNGMIPILSYNYAKRLDERVKQTMSLAFRFAVIYMGGAMVVLELFPSVFLTLFDASDTMMRIGTVALRLCCLSLPFGGACLIRSTFMQALNHANYTLILNICRQFVVIVGSFYILSVCFGNLDILWLAVLITEASCHILSVVLQRRMNQDLFQ